MKKPRDISHYTRSGCIKRNYNLMEEMEIIVTKFIMDMSLIWNQPAMHGDIPNTSVNQRMRMTKM